MSARGQFQTNQDGRQRTVAALSSETSTKSSRLHRRGPSTENSQEASPVAVKRQSLHRRSFTVPDLRLSEPHVTGHYGVVVRSPSRTPSSTPSKTQTARRLPPVKASSQELSLLPLPPLPPPPPLKPTSPNRPRRSPVTEKEQSPPTTRTTPRSAMINDRSRPPLSNPRPRHQDIMVAVEEMRMERVQEVEGALRRNESNGEEKGKETALARQLSLTRRQLLLPVLNSSRYGSSFRPDPSSSLTQPRRPSFSPSNSASATVPTKNIPIVTPPPSSATSPLSSVATVLIMTPPPSTATTATNGNGDVMTPLSTISPFPSPFPPSPSVSVSSPSPSSSYQRYRHPLSSSKHPHHHQHDLSSSSETSYQEHPSSERFVDRKALGLHPIVVQHSPTSPSARKSQMVLLDCA